jgi:gas vesicle protein
MSILEVISRIRFGEKVSECRKCVADSRRAYRNCVTDGGEKKEAKAAFYAALKELDAAENQVRPQNNERAWLRLAYSLIGVLFVWVLASIVALYSQRTSIAPDNLKPTIEIKFSPIISQSKNRVSGDVSVIYDERSIKEQVALWQPHINEALTKAYDSAMKDKTEAMQNRITDTWSAVQGIGLISAIIGVLITVLVLYFSFSNSNEISELAENHKNYLKMEAKDIIEKEIASQLESTKNEIQTSNRTQLSGFYKWVGDNFVERVNKGVVTEIPESKGASERTPVVGQLPDSHENGSAVAAQTGDKAEENTKTTG